MMGDAPMVATLHCDANERMREAADFWISLTPEMPAPVTVTVVIPSYNAASTLPRAVRSVLDQTVTDLELIIVDDASSDGSWALIKSFIAADRRVRAIRNKRNLGKPVAMNRAIAHAAGKWLAVLDADDWYDRERVAVLTHVGDRHDAQMVADNQFFFDASAGKLVGTAWPTDGRVWRLTCDGFLAASNAYETFNLGMLKPVLRTEFVRAKLVNYDERARHGHDFMYLVRFFCAGGRAVVINSPYYFYTQPFGDVSRQWSHGARCRYDFQTAHDLNAQLLANLGPRLTPPQQYRLRRRNRQLQLLEHYYRIKECLAVGAFLRGAALAVRSPAMFIYALRRARWHFFRQPGNPAIEAVAAAAPQLGYLTPEDHTA